MPKRLLLLPLLACSLFAQTRSLVIGPENRAALQQLAKYPALEQLKIACLEDLTALPDSLTRLQNLRELILDNGNGCQMNSALPEQIGNLTALRKLVLYGAQDNRWQEPGVKKNLRERHPFPKSIEKLIGLTYLDLGRNGFTTIPAFVQSLTNLKELHLDFNELTELPAFLANMPALKVVTLGNNCAITGKAARRTATVRRFPRIQFDFKNEYDCN